MTAPEILTIEDVFAAGPNAEAVRKIREFCEIQRQPCRLGKHCVKCSVQTRFAEEVLALLPPVDAKT